MSKSYKKTPSCHFLKKTPGAKARASRYVRRVAKVDDVPNGGAYKKFFDSYDISEWHDTYTTYEQHRDLQIALGKYVDEAQCREDYERFYRRK